MSDSVPAVTGSGLSLFVIDKSADVVTAVGAVAVLFAGTGSVVVLETVAVLLKPAVCAALTCTTKVSVVSAEPAAIVPRFQVTVPLLSVPPPVADTKLVPAGNGSETVTPIASPGPAVWTVRV